ncbi:hypothetical protein IE53DRAFT_246575 [Violaceomyces palustris]|uniref:Uncharacterized protein n=1 Tax=Violaceomyces palustris TaxID=1673888 RepID=A0ACD0P419_9BASI|nr:hypothetical protein IE53DRAFT_246575 [Violaceomyces palustris]
MHATPRRTESCFWLVVIRLESRASALIPTRKGMVERQDLKWTRLPHSTNLVQVIAPVLTSSQKMTLTPRKETITIMDSHVFAIPTRGKERKGEEWGKGRRKSPTTGADRQRSTTNLDSDLCKVAARWRWP